MPASTQFLAPRSVDEALDLLARGATAGPAPVVLAGGTDLWPHWTGEPDSRPAVVLSLHRLDPELRQIQGGDDGPLRVGASCTHRDLIRHEQVRRACPAVAAAAATIGALQIQNRGTVGGNLANGSPAADLPPPLVAAGAEVELASVEGRRTLPLVDLYQGYRQLDLRPAELLTAVLVPPLPAEAREHFRKVGTRRAQAISKVVGAARLELNDQGAITRAGLAFGSVGPTVARLAQLEAWLVGRAADDQTAAEAEERTRQEITPIDDLRSTAEYRKDIAGRLVRGWVLGCDRP